MYPTILLSVDTFKVLPDKITGALFSKTPRDFSKYADVPFAELALDFFLPDDTPLPSEIINS